MPTNRTLKLTILCISLCATVIAQSPDHNSCILPRQLQQDLQIPVDLQDKWHLCIDPILDTLHSNRFRISLTHLNHSSWSHDFTWDMNSQEVIRQKFEHLILMARNYESSQQISEFIQWALLGISTAISIILSVKLGTQYQAQQWRLSP